MDSKIDSECESESTPTDFDLTQPYCSKDDSNENNMPGPSTSTPRKRNKSHKHCCWGTCKTDGRYMEKVPDGTYFIPFPKPGKEKDGMTQWEVKGQKDRTEKSKRWINLCSRDNFTIKNINRHTYICSLHFIGGNGPTEENPDPIKASMNCPPEKKRKAPLLRGTPFKSRKKRKGTIKLDDISKINASDSLVHTSIDFEIGGPEIDAANEIPLYQGDVEGEVGQKEEKATQTVYDNWTYVSYKFIWKYGNGGHFTIRSKFKVFHWVVSARILGSIRMVGSSKI